MRPDYCDPFHDQWLVFFLLQLVNVELPILIRYWNLRLSDNGLERLIERGALYANALQIIRWRNLRITDQNHLTMANTKTAYANMPVTKIGICDALPFSVSRVFSLSSPCYQGGTPDQQLRCT